MRRMAAGTTLSTRILENGTFLYKWMGKPDCNFSDAVFSDATFPKSLKFLLRPDEIRTIRTIGIHDLGWRRGQ